ncbi:MAG: carbonic anhydrase, partial [Muribaculaceae bacterium]|nr:carbonic anhydrase [Muribaculaceae bacterium]
EHITLMEHCGINLREWLHGFEETESAVRETVDLISHHPLMPPEGVNVQGFLMDSYTGELTGLNL